eukprot:6477473-Amphidinium_carterae.3
MQSSQSPKTGFSSVSECDWHVECGLLEIPLGSIHDSTVDRCKVMSARRSIEPRSAGAALLSCAASHRQKMVPVAMTLL